LRKPVYIIPDFHEEDDARQLASQLGWRGHVLDVNYPDECKDMNDILIKYGEQKVLEVLNVN